MESFLPLNAILLHELDVSVEAGRLVELDHGAITLVHPNGRETIKIKLLRIVHGFAHVYSYQVYWNVLRLNILVQFLNIRNNGLTMRAFRMVGYNHVRLVVEVLRGEDFVSCRLAIEFLNC